MASAILSPLCKRLGDIALQEYELVRDVKEEVEKLRLTVSLIQKLLQDAEQKQVKDDVRHWLWHIKQLLYDAEDILDEAATDSALETRRVEYCASWSVCLNAIFGCDSIDEFLSRRNLARQIKHITMQLDDIYKKKDALGLKELIPSENVWPDVNTKRRRLDTSSLLMADEPRIVGRDDEKRKIIQRLMGSELKYWPGEPTSSTMRNVRVLALVGMGGVGKTTLAKLVFSDPTVKQHFHNVMIWVCVSENFDVKRITKEILEVIPSSPNQQTESLENLMNWDSAQQRLKAKIEGKKFLLVLDDVWKVVPSNWESLCGPLTYGGKGSRIIVTTRDQRVSNMIKASCFPLKSLSDEDLWPILKSYAFDGGSESHGLLESIGRQMVKKLKGSPLAAKTIGRLLNRSLDVRDWKDILDSEIFMLEQQDSEDILPVLKLSYDHLPGHLKQCFAYCSLFPKNYVFSRSQLAQHWVAQNFIQTTRGDQHFDDLLDMSFFEKTRFKRFSDNSRCVMHDLIHDLAESISEDDCFKWGDGVRPHEFSEAMRHLSIAAEHLDPMKLEELCKYGKLRTLHFLGRPRFDLSPLLLDNLFTKLKRLRVLGLQNCGILELPTSIGKLKHLRFVDLSNNFIGKLPESFCGLHNLQVLKLEHCYWLRALPGNTSALVNLMHLEWSYHDLVSSIQDLGKLTALQEVDIRGGKAKELGDMSMLRRLRIRNLEQVTGKEEAAQARLDTKEDLETLRLGWRKETLTSRDIYYFGTGDRRYDYGTLEEGVLEGLQPAEEEGVLEGLQPAYSTRKLDIRNYGGVRSPRWLEDPVWVSSSFLERVELRDCKKWEVLPPLGQLPGLKDLEISGMSSVRRIDPGQGGGGGFQMLGFPSLESLYFADMPEWEEWEAPHHHGDDDDKEGQQQQISFLPRLRTLEISDCPKLKELPPLPRSLKSLYLWNVGLTRLPRLGGCCGGGGGAGRDADHMSLSELSELYVAECPNLRSLDDDDGLLQHPLPRLYKLSVSVGSSSTAQQLLNSILQNQSVTATLRTLDITRVHHLHQQHQACSSSSNYIPSLMVPPAPPPPPEMEMVVVGPTNNLRDHLTALTSLGIGDCSDLLQLSGLPSSLERLSISGDTHLDDRILATYLQGLCRLTYLSIFGCPHITSLPTAEVLCHLTALQELRISYCEEMMSWGGGVHNLFALQELRIEGCPKLQCLPSVGLPKSLRQVRINGSSIPT